MLDAKRALLLAISHELRSPLTRARLNTELLPETPDVQPARDALLRDLDRCAT
jgi:signal transduction histidine kinase